MSYEPNHESSSNGDPFQIHRERAAEYAIFTLDPSGVVTSWSLGAEKLKHYRADEIVGQNFSCFYPITDIELGKPQMGLQRAELDGQFKDMGLRIRKDGTIFLAKVVITALRDNHGNLRGFSKVTQDVSDIRQVEKQLWNNEEIIQWFIEHWPFAVAIFNREMQYLFASQRWISDYGLEGLEIVGKSHYDIFPNLPDRWKEVYRRALNGETFTSSVDKFENADGSIQWLRWVVCGWKQNTHDRLYSGIVISAEDITARQKEIYKNEQIFSQMRFAIQASKVELWDWNFESNKTAFSNDLRGRLGYKSGEIVDDIFDWETLLHPDDLQRIKECRDDYIAGSSEFYDVKFRIKHANNTWRWIHSLGETYFDEQNRVTGMRGCNLDFTEQKQLTESLQLMRFCVDHSAESIFWTGRDGRLLYANKTACSERGYSLEEMLNMTVFDLDVHPDYQPDLWAKHFEDLKRRGSMTLETTHRAKNGRLFPVEVNANYVRVDDHEFNFASVRDITERTQKDERLRQKKDRLKQLSQELIRTRETELQNLAGALHDDIGQMLTAIKLNVRAIKASTDTINVSSLDALVTMIDQTTDRVRNLAINMRPPQLEHLGLVAALEWYLSTQSKIAGFGWKVIVNSDEIQISKDLSTTCFRITQESVTNALRHATAKNIVVELEQEDQKLFLTIRDDGIGFDVNSILQNAVTGKSFGLTNMQERAILMGGHIEFESIPLRGTIIRAVFPLTLTTNS